MNPIEPSAVERGNVAAVPPPVPPPSVDAVDVVSVSVNPHSHSQREDIIQRLHELGFLGVEQFLGSGYPLDAIEAAIDEVEAALSWSYRSRNPRALRNPGALVRWLVRQACPWVEAAAPPPRRRSREGREQPERATAPPEADQP